MIWIALHNGIGLETAPRGSVTFGQQSVFQVEDCNISIPIANFVSGRSRLSGNLAGSAGIRRLVKLIPLCPACDLENFIKALTIKELRHRQSP